MFHSHMTISQRVTDAFSLSREWQLISAPPQITFLPGLPSDVVNMIWVISRQITLFNENYASLTVGVRNVTDRVAPRACCISDLDSRTQSIWVNLSDNLDLGFAQNGAAITYCLIHELAVHAAPNSWEFAVRPNILPTRSEQNEITDRHHLNMFLAGESGDFHLLVKNGLQFYQGEACRRVYIRQYIEDVAAYINRLSESGVLTGQRRMDALAWGTRLEKESASVYSGFWYPGPARRSAPTC